MHVNRLYSGKELLITNKQTKQNLLILTLKFFPTAHAYVPTHVSQIITGI